MTGNKPQIPESSEKTGTKSGRKPHKQGGGGEERGSWY